MRVSYDDDLLTQGHISDYIRANRQRFSLSQSISGLIDKFIQGYTLIYSLRIAGVSAQLFNNAARLAGIQPYAEPGNAVYVGHGIAVGHRRTDPIHLNFPLRMNFYDLEGQFIASGNSFELNCDPGESQIILFEIANWGMAIKRKGEQPVRPLTGFYQPRFSPTRTTLILPGMPEKRVMTT